MFDSVSKAIDRVADRLDSMGGKWLASHVPAMPVFEKRQDDRVAYLMATEDGSGYGRLLEHTPDHGTVIWAMRPGGVIKPHYHDEHEQIVMLSGQVQSGDNKAYRSGQVIHHPPREVHSYRNPFEELAVYLVIFTPSVQFIVEQHSDKPSWFEDDGAALSVDQTVLAQAFQK